MEGRRRSARAGADAAAELAACGPWADAAGGGAKAATATLLLWLLLLLLLLLGPCAATCSMERKQRCEETRPRP
jgi:hypothetical protein